MNAPSPPGEPQVAADWGSYNRLLPFLRPYLGQLTIVILISFVSTGLALLQPYLSKLMIDRALLRADVHALLMIGAAGFYGLRRRSAAR